MQGKLYFATNSPACKGINDGKSIWNSVVGKIYFTIFQLVISFTIFP